MYKKIPLQRPKKYRDDIKAQDQKELASFAREQFFRLMEKNLRVPVKLYHL